MSFLPPGLARKGEPPPRLAVIDLGSNTAHMTVLQADPRDTRRLRILEELQVITGLGRDPHDDGSLCEAGRRGALHALAHFSRRLDSLGVAPSAVRGATTSAVREAPNGHAFLAEVSDRTGIELDIVSGEEEAALTALAQARSFPEHLPFVVADIGGGSTEVVLREHRGTAWATSLPVGSLKLAAAHRDDVESLTSAVDEALDQLPELRSHAALVVVAGTATTALQIVAGRDLWDPDHVHGGSLERGALRDVRDRLAAIAPAERRRSVPGLVPGRADAITAGMTLLLGLMDWADTKEVVVSDRGVRYGLLWRAWPRAVVL